MRSSRHRVVLAGLAAAVLAGVLVAPSARAVSTQVAVPAAASGTAVTGVYTGPSSYHTCAVLKGATVNAWLAAYRRIFE